MKRILIFLLTLLCVFSLSLPAYAHDVPQERHDCSIEVVVRFNEENVNGGTLTAVKVGYVEEENGNYFFSQEKTGDKIADVSSSSAHEAQEKFYWDNKGNFEFYTQTQPVQDGKVTFSDLSTGLYLIMQQEAAPGFSKMGTFLVSVPYMQDGQYQYHLTAVVKPALEREPEPTEPPPTKPTDPKLPQTGQLNWPIPLMAAVGFALFAAGCLLRRKQSED